MSPTRRHVFLACALPHLALVALVCLHETFWLLDHGLTVVPPSQAGLWQKLDFIPRAVLGDELAATNPFRRAILTYSNAAGIEVGYGYFAPNVPETHALVFECHYADGHVDYRTAAVRSEEGDLRLTSLIEQIGRTDYDRWRQELVKRLARPAWQSDPGVVSVRGLFGIVISPTIDEYRAGKQKQTFKCLHVYEFKVDRSTQTLTAP
jgi:hypothetical protein